MRISSRLVTALAGMAALLLACPADATSLCTFVEYAAAPAPTAPAPLNTHVWLTLDRHWEKRGFCKVGPAPDLDTLRCLGGDYALSLRRAGGVHAPAEEVAFERRDAVADNEMTVELVPRAPLAPVTRYEVWQIDRQGVQPARILLTFKTGTAADTTPPRLGSLALTSYAGPKKTRPASKGLAPSPGASPAAAPPMTFPLDDTWERPTGPALTLEGDEAVDDETQPAQLLLGVWVADAGAKIDYAKPPQVWLRQPPPEPTTRNAVGPMKVALRLGEGDGCSRANWEGPSGPSVTGAFTVGVRAADLAGNLSPPREIAVGARPVPRR